MCPVACLWYHVVTGALLKPGCCVLAGEGGGVSCRRADGRGECVALLLARPRRYSGPGAHRV